MGNEVKKWFETAVKDTYQTINLLLISKIIVGIIIVIAYLIVIFFKEVVFK